MSSAPSTPPGQPRRSPLFDFANTPVRVFADLGVPGLAGCRLTGQDLDHYLRKLLRADAQADRDEFNRGMRMALVVEYRLSQEEAPDAPRMPVKQRIERCTGIRYETAQKYRRFLELQVRLSIEKLPLIKSVNQGRVLLPFAKGNANELIAAVRDLGGKELPSPKQLKQELARRLPAPVSPAGNIERRVIAKAKALRADINMLPKSGRERKKMEALLRLLIARTEKPVGKLEDTSDVTGQMLLPGTCPVDFVQPLTG